jgi:hypothetical protein
MHECLGVGQALWGVQGCCLQKMSCRLIFAFPVVRRYSEVRQAGLGEQPFVGVGGRGADVGRPQLHELPAASQASDMSWWPQNRP